MCTELLVDKRWKKYNNETIRKKNNATSRHGGRKKFQKIAPSSCLCGYRFFATPWCREEEEKKSGPGFLYSYLHGHRRHTHSINTYSSSWWRIRFAHTNRVEPQIRIDGSSSCSESTFSPHSNLPELKFSKSTWILPTARGKKVFGS